ncbi:hypothetical protein [Streptomyces sp. Cmuel-A718b]|uniref:hypothetical protein n=1 Tax=Streptomyces sp. Cmuel-A718b TaxID=697328 RepID=UPI00081EAB45|nr:hypothetical protein [Streptomyces sp. Cmuel-A718b]SCF71299.1 hypothetical protein GA0115280_108013 [Streptomyces sp. Cmuel-A718b]
MEAEHFGGAGRQRAAVWAVGSLTLDPLDEPTKQDLSRAVSPVSQALRRLGAQRGVGKDEFESVGLNHHRTNEDWIGDAYWAQGTACPWPLDDVGPTHRCPTRQLLHRACFIEVEGSP